MFRLETIQEGLIRVYGKEHLEESIARCQAMQDGFSREFGRAPGAESIWISAPGRTEISGNHTDHQHGVVLAASIDRDVLALVEPTKDSRIRIFSEGYGWIETEIEDHPEPAESEFGTTKALVRGVFAEFLRRGYNVGGFSAYLQSQVLGGSGLSSSAAFETAMGEIFNHLYNAGAVGSIEIAEIGCQAERDYFGKPCGLMDQMACSVGSLCYIDFEKPNNPEVESLSLRPEDFGYALCIVDTKGSHADLTEDYAAVGREMKRVAEVLGKKVLRSISKKKLLSHGPVIREMCGDRAFLRAYHFVTEEERVIRQKQAIQEGDFTTFLKLFGESGASSFRFLQNVYAPKDAEHQGISVAIAVSESVLGEEGEFGRPRVHGGGFAGTMQAFVKQEKVKEFTEALDQIFGPGSCQVYHIRPYGGTIIK